MLGIIIIGLVMIGINILFSYLELRKFLNSVGEENQSTITFRDKMTYPFRILKHFPELIPSIIDIVAMVLLTKLFNLGNGYAGGIAGLFASNILSIIIFMHTHHGKREEVEYVSH